MVSGACKGHGWLLMIVKQGEGVAGGKDGEAGVKSNTNTGLLAWDHAGYATG